MDRKTIMIIDDDEIFSFLMRETLTSKYHFSKIETLNSGTDALERLFTSNNSTNSPDIILVDINMPGMNGWEFINKYQQKVHLLNKRPRLYVISSSVSDEDKTKALKIKCVNGFIEKPIKNIDLF